MSFFNSIFNKKSEFALKLERILGFSPKQMALYRQAFTHKSIIQEKHQQDFESNERLEFLGDAILDSIVSNYLFQKFPFKDEGYLTQLRSRLVSRNTLNQLGQKLGLNEFIDSKLDKESKTVLGDAIEALIGAVYLDKGYLLAEQFVVEKLIQTHLNIEEIMETETDFKSRVLEWTQKNRLQLRYQITEKEENNNKLFTAELLIDNELKGKGTAFSKKKAEQLASEIFYKEINNN